MSKTSFSSISLARSGSSISPRLSDGSIGCWQCCFLPWERLRIPRVSWVAIETTRTISDVDLGAKDEGDALIEHRAIEAESWPSISPDWSWRRSGAPAIGVYCQTCSGIPLAIMFVGRDRLHWNLMVQGTQRFRQVQAASLRNTLRPVWFVLP